MSTCVRRLGDEPIHRYPLGAEWSVGAYMKPDVLWTCPQCQTVYKMEFKKGGALECSGCWALYRMIERPRHVVSMGRDYPFPHIRLESQPNKRLFMMMMGDY